MKVTNWLGQDITAGDFVYRGAREGNSSSFKVGRVVRVNTASDKVTVEWAAEAPYTEDYVVWENGQKVNLGIPASWPMGRKGTCTKNAVIVVDEDIYKYAVSSAQAAKNTHDAWKGGALRPEKAKNFYEADLKRLLKEYEVNNV